MFTRVLFASRARHATAEAGWDRLVSQKQRLAACDIRSNPRVAGGAKGIRTPDLCSAIAALSQLSYSPEPANFALSDACGPMQRRFRCFSERRSAFSARCRAGTTIHGRRFYLPDCAPNIRRVAYPREGQEVSMGYERNDRRFGSSSDRYGSAGYGNERGRSR